jgi:regulation of enolase protein 1 (concanavalin A-like superfamily)
MKKHIHPCSEKTPWFRQTGPSTPYAIALALALALGHVAAFAQISIPNAGFTYTQDFNTLAASGTSTAVPAGWAFFETSNVFGGANMIYRAGDASGPYLLVTYDTYSFGATGDSDRAFGSVTSTNQDSMNSTIGACFTNNTGSIITSMTVTYTGETWRVSSQNRQDGLVFQYNQNTTAINGAGTWTAVTALDYFNPGAPTVGGGSLRHSAVVSATISGLNIAPGNTFCFRWLNFNTPPATPNQEDALGIDDFSLSNIVVCTPPVVTAPSVTQPTCVAPSGGTITVNATGISTLEYSVNNGSTWSTNPVFSGLAAGNYHIKVRLQANPACETTYGSNPVVLSPPFTASTTTDTWTGCVSTDWATAGNWADGSVPTAADDVTIPDVANDPVILGGTAAVAKSVLVQASAVFTIQATGSLAINGATGFALETFGNFDNFGTLLIGNISSVANIGIVHRSGGTLNNKPNGLIQIDRTGGAEAFYTSGEVNNEATINIGINATVSGNGISVDGGTFNNNLGGSIQIEQTTGYGVFTGGNGGVFNNNATGSLRINRISNIGVINFSTFYNAGTLTIGDIAFSGQDDIENYATFTNASTGIISVDRAFSNGIWHITGTFQNSGKITVGSIANTGTGILSYVPFTNSAGAEIHIDRAPNGIVSTNAFTNAGLIRMGENAPLTGSGIVNTGATAVLNNNAGGDISIKQTAVDGVQNDANSTFNNNACATLTVFDNLNNAGTFTNAGLMTVNTTQTHTNSALTNNGIIAYPQGNPIPNVTNNEIVIAPSTANTCDVISPAFGLGSPVDFTIMGIFTDQAATMSAGTYVTATNTFTPTTILAEGAYTFYVKVLDGSGGCTRIIPWQLTTQNCCPAGNVLYVNANASGANNGSSWTDAFTDLQSALGSTCPNITEIWVAAGTYKPTSGTDRNISFVMKNGVAIYGGFSGNGTETLLSQRNWTTNVTILSGDIGTVGNNSDNTDHIILNNNNGLTNSAVLDGFTITGGNAISGYGGGMYNSNASPTVANCTFAQNSASFTGGAVYQTGTYNSSFTGCRFDANSAPFGGALSNSGFAPSAGTTRLTNCYFTNNTATNGGGAINNGFSNTTGTSLCIFTNCTFLNNTCHNGSTIGTGGAYQSQFVGFNADFINCDFNGNKALGTADDGGGAIMIYAGAVTLVNSTIANSQSATNGGAVNVYNSNGSVVIKNSILWNNAASIANSIYNGNGGSANAEYSLLQESACPPNTTCGAGMIYNNNPLFTSATDLRLQACSPAINAGSNPAVPGSITTDLDNNPRTFGGTVDMGAYELQVAPTPIVPVCQNQTVLLNDMGMATFSPALLSNGTTGCGTLLYTVGGQSTLNFTCADTAAPIPVTLTVTDDRGITATCSAMITVVDNTAPTITCPATQTLVLGANCTATLPDYTGMATTSDNCGVQSVTQSPAAGTTVSGAGNMTVTLTVTDVNGLTNTCTFTVTKMDNTAPTITCPNTQTLALGANCSASLPDYTNLATTADGCGVQSVTQSPAAGTTVSGAGNMTVTLTVTDVNGMTNTCTFTVTKVDNTAPSITCPATQTLALGTSCAATLPDYTSMATIADNCGVQSVMQSPTAGTPVSGAGDMTVTLTVTDINGLTNTCTFTVTKVDNTAPSITCPSTQTLVLGANCTATLTNYTSLATTSDNCGVQSVTQSPAAGTTVSGAGNMTVTLTATDVNGLTNTCTFTVTKVDNTAPTVQCFNQTLNFNGEGSITLDADDLAEASDNCGVQSISLSPNTISAERVGQIVPVTVTATDINGNVATCTAQITVSGFPAGWSQQPGGAGCSGNNNAYNSGTGVWTATSTNCFYGPPYTSDATSFVQRTLCGDGSLTAQVTSISGSALGWAGIVMRESNAPGAKKAQLMTNLSSLHRREFRTTTNGAAQPQQSASNGRYWLRITRAGNQFTMSVSANGTSWFLIGAQNIVMGNCIQMGLIATNYTANSTVTATFAGVSYTGSNATAATTQGVARAASLESPYSFEAYPNPTSGELNLDLSQYIGRSIRIETYSLEGKLLQFSEIEEVQATVEQLNLKSLSGGMYLVKLKSAGLPDATRRIVVNRN